MSFTPRSLQSLAMISMICIPAFAQIKFDTFPRVVEAPLLSEEKMQAAADLHSFIWEHWIGHRRAIAEFRSISKEGMPYLSTIIIAPDHKQRWAITEIALDCMALDKGTKDFPPSVRIAHSLEVVELQPSGSMRVVHDPHSPFPVSYRLRVVEANGNESIF
jgi:hypothetical protein